MDVGIIDLVPHDAHNFRDVEVYFYGDRITTLVTNDPSEVSRWLSDIQRIHCRRLNKLIVGLDVEWRPSFTRHRENPVATLQLCVGRRCLVFQILRCDEEFDNGIPLMLGEFLADGDFTFVGVGIKGDVEKLAYDYGLEVGGKIVDLRRLAADEFDDNRLRNAGLKELATVVLGREVDKPRRVTLSAWDNRWLTDDQVKYACLDAYVSFEIGRVLDAHSY